MRETCVFWTRAILANRFPYPQTAGTEAYSSCIRKQDSCFQVQWYPSGLGASVLQSHRRPQFAGFAEASDCSKSEGFGLNVILKSCRGTPGSELTITQWNDWSLEVI